MVSVLSHNGNFQKRQKLSGVLSNGTIGDIKALIERRAGLKASAQRLRLDDHSTPQDDTSLQALGLVDGSHLSLLRPPPKQQQSAPPPAPLPRVSAPAPERTSSSGSNSSSPDQLPKPSAFAAIVPRGTAAVTSTPTRPGRAQQLLASQVRALPVLPQLTGPLSLPHSPT
jgi:hypothetical protein